MSIPNVEEERILADYTRNEIGVRLYSNDYTPIETSTAASFTEVSGGGYVMIPLASGSWVITLGDPTEAEYAEQTFTFTGATDAPGTIYGYFLTDLITGLYIGGQRLPGAVTPLTPVNGSIVHITPLIQAS